MEICCHSLCWLRRGTASRPVLWTLCHHPHSTSTTTRIYPLISVIPQKHMMKVWRTSCVIASLTIKMFPQFGSNTKQCWFSSINCCTLIHVYTYSEVINTYSVLLWKHHLNCKQNEALHILWCSTIHLYVEMCIQEMRFKHSTRIWMAVSTLTRCINSVLISCTASSSRSPSSWQTLWSRGDSQVRTHQKHLISLNC